MDTKKIKLSFFFVSMKYVSQDYKSLSRIFTLKNISLFFVVNIVTAGLLYGAIYLTMSESIFFLIVVIPIAVIFLYMFLSSIYYILAPILMRIFIPMVVLVFVICIKVFVGIGEILLAFADIIRDHLYKNNQNYQYVEEFDEYCEKDEKYYRALEIQKMFHFNEDLDPPY